MIFKGLTRAQRIACDSEATRSDLLRVAGVSAQRVSRVYISLNHPYSPMEGHEARQRIHRLLRGLAGPFLLHVGGNQWYKNRLGVLRIFSVLRRLSNGNALKLVLAGKPWTPEMRQFIFENGMSNLVFELAGVDNEDLRALYSTATMLLFPSLYEGFGWPILEAQACGCPVATSNSPPMNEIGGSAAVYIDPENPDSAAATLNHALETAPDMRGPSLTNAARFRTGMTESYLSLYEEVIAEKSATTIRERKQPVTRASSYSAGGVQ
jgi:glycosyltransferase involved in cell wall biosynthesis